MDSYRPSARKQRGFTIIEVLIVLAVASLILVMVFYAVPQLRRNQRNDARKADVRSLIVAIQNCIASNGSVRRCNSTDKIKLDPDTDFAIFEDFAVQKVAGDSSGTIPIFSAQDLKNGNPKRLINNVWQNMPVIWVQKKCGGEFGQNIQDAGGFNEYAINFPLEAGANPFTDNKTGFCLDSRFDSPDG